MDECSEWELNDILDYLPWTDRNLWESQRLNAYITSRANFKGIHEFKDVCSFKWELEDEEPEEVRDIEISDDDITRLTELTKLWEDKK